jgi:hypothetical protein
MSMKDLGTTFQTNSFGFNLPCRQFAVSAERTTERRLPMVDEFILRTLYLVESISVAKLARFFGFEGKDIGIAISDLQARGLITIEDDLVKLHASAQELFRTSDESAPTITVAEPLNAHVWFDLITRHMVAGRGLRNVQNLITLRAPEGATLNVNDARDAFHTHFRDYLRIVRNDKSADQWNLYSILDVHAGRYSYAQISGTEILNIDGNPSLETHLLTDQLDSSNRTRKLNEAMAAELSRREWVEPSQIARSEYSRLIGSDSLELATRQDRTVDLIAWIQSEDRVGSDESSWLIGYPYLERNRRKIATLVAELRPDLCGDRELLWQRSGGARWGATDDVSLTLEALRSSIRNIERGGLLRATLLTPASVPTSEAKLFNKLFDRGLFLQSGQSSPALEILVIPGIFALVSVLVRIGPSVAIPIGRVTVAQKEVERIFERSKLASIVSGAHQIWPQAHKPRDDIKASADLA